MDKEPYVLETDKYHYEVEREVGQEVFVRCTHVETGVTAEARGLTQYVARQYARLRVERIIEEEQLLARGPLRRANRERELQRPGHMVASVAP